MNVNTRYNINDIAIKPGDDRKHYASGGLSGKVAKPERIKNE